MVFSEKQVLAASLIRLRTTLACVVPLKPLTNYDPPDFLYTAGNPGRYNGRGIDCIYFAEDIQTALIEYRHPLRNFKLKNQPLGLYSAKVELSRVLDLSSSQTLHALNIDAKDLYKPWRKATQATITQAIGRAVSQSKDVSAIRLPSDAAREEKRIGWNIVIFKNKLPT